jgi:hypothetical protein
MDIWEGSWRFPNSECMRSYEKEEIISCSLSAAVYGLRMLEPCR